MKRMDQEKIGKFIVELRKAKKMTQQDLADRLNVTDRAVSHWENGRRIPDVSLFKPICEIFDISVNELISGEKITKDKIIKKSDENIMNTINDSESHKRKSKRIIISLLISILFLIFFIVFSFKRNHPNIDIYNFTVSPADIEKPYVLTKKFMYENRSIYFYGIDSAILCDKNEYCYQIQDAIQNKQTSLDQFQKYLEKQAEYENVKIDYLFDGGTTIYKKSGFLIVYCNTLDGNKDVYIGNLNMLDDLNGGYCGHSPNQNKSFIRTYKVIRSTIHNDEFNELILEQNNGTRGSVFVNNSYLLVPGKTYEFSFLTFDEFYDTIENIFKYSTLLKVNSTDKILNEQINEDIFVNKDVYNDVELNELEHVKMDIRDGTLTRTSATVIITDYSGKYRYGSDFRLDKFENGKWQEVKNICSNCAFNAMAYGPDQNGFLTFDIHWERMYGALSQGKYRVVKSALLRDETCFEKKCKHYYFSVEFYID